MAKPFFTSIDVPANVGSIAAAALSIALLAPVGARGASTQSASVVVAPTAPVIAPVVITPGTMGSTVYGITLERAAGSTGPIQSGHGLTPAIVAALVAAGLNPLSAARMHRLDTGAEIPMAAPVMLQQPVVGPPVTPIYLAVLLSDVPDLAAGSSLACELRWSAQAPATRRPAIVPTDVPDGWWRPTSLDDAIAANIVPGRISKRSQTSVLPAVYAQMETYMDTGMANSLAQYGTVFAGGSTATWGRPRSLAQRAVRDGSMLDFRTLCLMTRDYYTNANWSGTQPVMFPWYQWGDQIVAHYWLTGFEHSRQMIRWIGAMSAQQVGGNLWNNPNKGDDRGRARRLETTKNIARFGMYDPIFVGTYQLFNGNDITAIDTGQLRSAAGVGTDFDAFFTTQGTTYAYGGAPTIRPGGWGGYQYSHRQTGESVGGSGPIVQGGQKNYMVGMMNSSLCTYYDEVNPDVRVPTAIKKTIDDQEANEAVTGWGGDSGSGTAGVPTAIGYNYETVNIADSANSEYAGGGPGCYPEHNVIEAHKIAWYAAWCKAHGDAAGAVKYRAICDRMISDFYRTARQLSYFQSGKGIELTSDHLYDTIALRLAAS